VSRLPQHHEIVKPNFLMYMFETVTFWVLLCIFGESNSRNIHCWAAESTAFIQW